MDDSARSISFLRSRHQEALDAIKQINHAAIELDRQHFADDIFILRFLIQHGFDTEKAAKFHAAACQWRFERRDALANASKPLPFDHLIDRYWIKGLHKTTSNGSPVFVSRSGVSNVKRMMDEVPEASFREHIQMMGESIFRQCDEASRREGRILSAVMINDLSHVSMSTRDKRFFSVVGDAYSGLEGYYPLLFGRKINLGMPSFIRAMHVVVKLLVKNLFHDVEICCGDLQRVNVTSCPVAKRMFPLENLPTFLGGMCDCPGGCVGGVANNVTHAVADARESETPTEASAYVHAPPIAAVDQGIRLPMVAPIPTPLPTSVAACAGREVFVHHPTGFTPPPPPPHTFLAALLRKFEKAEADDKMAAALRRWMRHVEAWAACHTEDERPTSPCPTEADSPNVESWAQRMGEWYTAHFAARVMRQSSLLTSHVQQAQARVMAQRARRQTRRQAPTHHHAPVGATTCLPSTTSTIAIVTPTIIVGRNAATTTARSQHDKGAASSWHHDPYGHNVVHTEGRQLHHGSSLHNHPFHPATAAVEVTMYRMDCPIDD